MQGLTQEGQRLQVLYRYRALLQLPSDAFNSIAELMSATFNVPIAVITIIDAQTVYLKGSVGVPPNTHSVPKHSSLTVNTVESNCVTVYENTRTEISISDKASITGENAVAFYAGAPLQTTDGFSIGSVCIADKEPRSFSEKEKQILVRFAEYVMEEIEKKKDSFIKEEFERSVQLARKEAVWDWNLVTGELRWDKGFEQIFGLESKTYDAGVDLWLEHIHPEDRERLKNNTEVVKLGEREEWIEEYRFKKADDTYTYVLDRGRVIFDEDGNIYRMVGSMIDVNDQVTTQHSLRKQHEITQTITDNATVALLMMNKDGYCTFMNPAAEKLTGYSFEEIKEKPLHYMIHHHRPDGSFYPKEECPIDRALPENNNIRAHEDVFIRKDGTFFPVSCAASPLFENGIPTATVIEVRDLTEQKRSEELIKQKTRSLALLNEIGKSLSQEFDLQKILQRVTDITTKLSGAEFGAFFYNTVNAHGESFMLYTLSGASKESFSKFPMPRNTEVFHPTFAGEGIVRSDDITKDSRYGKSDPHYGMPKGHLPVRSYLAVPVFGQNNNVIGGLFFGHSKTGVFTQEHEDLVAGVASQSAIAIENSTLFQRLKTANEKNEALLELARELNEKKDEFLSIASHELKTPLTTIRGYNQLLQKSEVSAFAQKQLAAIKKLERLINDLLDVSKINSGHLQFNKELTDLKETVDHSIESAIHVLGEHRIHKHFSDERFEVFGDRVRLEQVIDNLLSNAVKYSPGSKDIDVYLKSHNGYAILTVKDYGLGIEEEHLTRIFDRFYRIETKAKHLGGLGLGLFISIQIVKEHQGTIWVESSPGAGSSFHVSLPLYQSEIPEKKILREPHLYRDEYIEIQYDERRNQLNATWMGLQDYQSIANGGTVIIEYIQKTKATKILNDNSLVIGNWSDASEEGKDVWFPALAALGIKVFAWILSEDKFSQLSALSSTPQNIDGLEIVFCKNKEEAQERLDQFPI